MLSALMQSAKITPKKAKSKVVKPPIPTNDVLTPPVDDPPAPQLAAGLVQSGITLGSSLIGSMPSRLSQMQVQRDAALQELIRTRPRMSKEALDLMFKVAALTGPAEVPTPELYGLPNLPQFPQMQSPEEPEGARTSEWADLGQALSGIIAPETYGTSLQGRLQKQQLDYERRKELWNSRFQALQLENENKRAAYDADLRKALAIHETEKGRTDQRNLHATQKATADALREPIARVQKVMPEIVQGFNDLAQTEARQKGLELLVREFGDQIQHEVLTPKDLMNAELRRERYGIDRMVEQGRMQRHEEDLAFKKDKFGKELPLAERRVIAQEVNAATGEARYMLDSAEFTYQQKKDAVKNAMDQEKMIYLRSRYSQKTADELRADNSITLLNKLIEATLKEAEEAKIAGDPRRQKLADLDLKRFRKDLEGAYAVKAGESAKRSSGALLPPGATVTLPAPDIMKRYGPGAGPLSNGNARAGQTSTGSGKLSPLEREALEALKRLRKKK